MTGTPAPGQPPYVRGFTVKWTGTRWKATSSSGAFVLYGKDAAELEAARRQVYAAELAAFRQALHDTFRPGQPIYQV